MVTHAAIFVLMGQCWFRLATIDGYCFCLDTTLALHMKHMKLQQKENTTRTQCPKAQASASAPQALETTLHRDFPKQSWFQNIVVPFDAVAIVFVEVAPPLVALLVLAPTDQPSFERTCQLVWLKCQLQDAPLCRECASGAARETG